MERIERGVWVSRMNGTFSVTVVGSSHGGVEYISERQGGTTVFGMRLTKFVMIYAPKEGEDPLQRVMDDEVIAKGSKWRTFSSNSAGSSYMHVTVEGTAKTFFPDCDNQSYVVPIDAKLIEMVAYKIDGLHVVMVKTRQEFLSKFERVEPDGKKPVE